MPAEYRVLVYERVSEATSAAHRFPATIGYFVLLPSSSASFICHFHASIMLCYATLRFLGSEDFFSTLVDTIIVKAARANPG